MALMLLPGVVGVHLLSIGVAVVVRSGCRTVDNDNGVGLAVVWTQSTDIHLNCLSNGFGSGSSAMVVARTNCDTNV